MRSSYLGWRFLSSEKARPFSSSSTSRTFSSLVGLAKGAHQKNYHYWFNFLADEGSSPPLRTLLLIMRIFFFTCSSFFSDVSVKLVTRKLFNPEDIPPENIQPGNYSTLKIFHRKIFNQEIIPLNINVLNCI